jgi:hypothetical protein
MIWLDYENSKQLIKKIKARISRNRKIIIVNWYYNFQLKPEY